MYRTMRSARPALNGLRTSTIRAAPRRFASTAPADRPRTWKGSALRWGLAVGAVYYYNTSPVFADEAPLQTIPAPGAFDSDELPTVDSIVEEKRKQIKERLEKGRSKPASKPVPTPEAKAAETATPEAAETSVASPAALEEEADQQGAFNPETGEINWDCPCLGGMADGPCGEEFKSAFSCFVYSTEEPKGMDCIEKFSGMQECFRKYPEIYGGELTDEEVDETADAPAPAPEGAVLKDATAPSFGVAEARSETESISSSAPKSIDPKTVDAEELIPTPAFDATQANEQPPTKKEIESKPKTDDK